MKRKMLSEKVMESKQDKSDTEEGLDKIDPVE